MVLWTKVAEKSQPIHRDKPKLNVTVDEKMAPVKKAKLSSSVAAVSKVQKPGPKISTADHIAMDAKSFKKMKRGALRPEAKLDLHGLTLVQAHAALIAFVGDAFAKQKRLVLVVTGKGKKSDTDHFMSRPTGVLRSQVPQWLALPPLSRHILQVTEAHQKHGGSGAFYVYLKRLR
ncbi:Smr/MutS family protein [Parasulfitobacter algicola]|nr:Smr/MutS family protein [Sulfitobacter algicola]